MTALGVTLLIIGAILVTAEAHVSTLGALGGPGVIALGLGSVLAVSGLGGGIALAVIATLVLVSVALGAVAVSLRGGLQVRRRQIRGGAEGLIGHCGVVQNWMEPSGKVLVDGALWHARHSWDEDHGAELHAGDPVVVERISGLTLSVRRAEEWEL